MVYAGKMARAIAKSSAASVLVLGLLACEDIPRRSVGPEGGPYTLCLESGKLVACPEDQTNSVDACTFGDKRACDCAPPNTYTKSEPGVEHCWRDDDDLPRWEHACWRDGRGGDEGYGPIRCD